MLLKFRQNKNAPLNFIINLALSLNQKSSKANLAAFLIVVMRSFKIRTGNQHKHRPGWYRPEPQKVLTLNPGKNLPHENQYPQ